MNYTDEQIIKALEDAVICVGQAPFVEKVAKGEQLKSDIIDLINCLKAENEKLNGLRNLPTADIEEVRHGEWKPRTGLYYDYYCSNCDGDAIEYESSYGSIEYHLTDYCYHCGALMDGGGKNDL